MKNKYEINDVVWFISGTGSILPARIRNVVIKHLGYAINHRVNYVVEDTFFEDRTEITYDLGNDLTGMAENTLFSSAEEALKSIKI